MKKFKLLDMVDNQTAVKGHLNLDIAYKKSDYTYPYQGRYRSYKKTVSELSEKMIIGVLILNPILKFLMTEAWGLP